MNVDFWDTHGYWFVLFMCFFPRLTMLFATAFGGGFWYWAGWLLAPRFTVAVIATHLYGASNTAMVVFTWLWAAMGEGVEKSTGQSGSRLDSRKSARK